MPEEAVGPDPDTPPPMVRRLAKAANVSKRLALEPASIVPTVGHDPAAVVKFGTEIDMAVEQEVGAEVEVTTAIVFATVGSLAAAFAN